MVRETTGELSEKKKNASMRVNVIEAKIKEICERV